jgi:hypothetical protein
VVHNPDAERRRLLSLLLILSIAWLGLLLAGHVNHLQIHTGS